ncbi:pseudouridylate synthase RPUSD4, mitochondrial isoform X2 [Podarcis muralis]
MVARERKGRAAQATPTSGFRLLFSDSPKQDGGSEWRPSPRSAARFESWPEGLFSQPGRGRPSQRPAAGGENTSREAGAEEKAGRGGPKVKMCITDVLPVLAKMLDGMKAEPLHLCHRLDKETTGVMVLARDEDTAHQIQQLFKTRQVEKKYWAICIGEPKPAEGVVDIPIMEKEAEGNQLHYKMTLAPNYRMSSEDGNMFKVRKHRDASMAVTQYRVLSSSSSCSLLELHPVTGVKHQIRVHLAYGLGCPILGDHKYSHWNKLAPQKLPKAALKRLGLEQVKARHLPLHLHACQLTLPAKNGSEEDKIHLVCKPPLFFIRSLQRLKLEFPEIRNSEPKQ